MRCMHCLGGEDGGGGGLDDCNTSKQDVEGLGVDWVDGRCRGLRGNYLIPRHTNKKEENTLPHIFTHSEVEKLKTKKY